MLTTLFILLTSQLSHESFDLSFRQFLYNASLNFTVSATLSFHLHVSLCLHGPSDFPHMFSAVFTIFFTCCHCSFASRCCDSFSSTHLWPYLCIPCMSFHAPVSIAAALVQTSGVCDICLIYSSTYPLPYIWKSQYKHNRILYYWTVSSQHQFFCF